LGAGVVGVRELDARGFGLADVDVARAAAEGVFRASARTGPAGWVGEALELGAGWRPRPVWLVGCVAARCVAAGWLADGGADPSSRRLISVTPRTAPTAMTAATADGAALCLSARQVNDRSLRCGVQSAGRR
jgi:hypothetical protein